MDDYGYGILGKSCYLKLESISFKIVGVCYGSVIVMVFVFIMLF